MVYYYVLQKLCIKQCTGFLLLCSKRLKLLYVRVVSRS
jgi:hypothetical protein